MTATILPNGKQQFIDINGKPLVGGTVGMYVVNTLIPKDTWVDAGQLVLNTNPIILDARGQAVIYGTGVYRQIVRDSVGNLIWDQLVYAPVDPASYPFVTPEMFGAKADGTTDDAAAFNAAFTAAALTGATVIGTGKTYKINSQLTFDMAKTGFNGFGSILDMTSISTGTGFSITTSSTDPNTMTGEHNKRPLCNFQVYGPNKSTGLAFITPVPVTLSGSPWFAGGLFENIGAYGWGAFFRIINGVFFQSFREIYYGGRSAGGGAGFFLWNTGTANCGENIALDHCLIINATGLMLDQAGNANMDIYADNCSVDGATYIGTGGSLAAPGTVGMACKMFLDGGHWENITYTDYTIWCSASGRVTTQSIEHIVPATVAHVPFRSDATQLGGGIVLNDHDLVSAGGTWPNGILCDGSGRFVINGLSGSGNTFLINSSIASNRVPSYTLPTSGSMTTNWSGGIYDNAVKPTGATASIKVTTGNTTASFDTPCSPGQTCTMQGKVQFTSVGAGDMLTLEVVYNDAGANVIGTAAVTTLSSAIPAFATEGVFSQTIAPPGTKTATFAMIYTASGGGASAWLGLPNVTVT